MSTNSSVDLGDNLEFYLLLFESVEGHKTLFN